MKDYEIRVKCPKCGKKDEHAGDVRDVVATLNAVRDRATHCRTCPLARPTVEAWQPGWAGKYVSGFHGPRGWEEDGDSDYVRADAASYVYVWRLQNEAMDAEPFHFEEYGDGTQIEKAYSTEAEALAALEDVRDGLEDGDELVLEHVRPTCLETRA